MKVYSLLLRLIDGRVAIQDTGFSSKKEAIKFGSTLIKSGEVDDYQVREIHVNSERALNIITIVGG